MLFKNIIDTTTKKFIIENYELMKEYEGEVLMMLNNKKDPNLIKDLKNIQNAMLEQQTIALKYGIQL